MRLGPNPSGLCICGCGQPTPLATRTDARRHTVKGKSTRFLRGHSARRSPIDYTIDPATGCWLWQLHVGPLGYGRVTRGGGVTEYAHRHYYEQHKGPIPHGLQLDHLCRVRHCVNPDHLEAVTPAENTRRGANAKLTLEDVAHIRDSEESRAALALRYGISVQHVSAIRLNHAWSQVAA